MSLQLQHFCKPERRCNLCNAPGNYAASRAIGPRLAVRVSRKVPNSPATVQQASHQPGARATSSASFLWLTSRSLCRSCVRVCTIGDRATEPYFRTPHTHDTTAATMFALVLVFFVLSCSRCLVLALSRSLALYWRLHLASLLAQLLAKIFLTVSKLLESFPKVKQQRHSLSRLS